jgi:YVTN family beta-propeller protein
MDSCSRTASRSNATRAAQPWGVIAVISAFLAQAALAQMQLEPPSSGLINPRAIVFSPATKKVYAVDSSQGEIQIYAAPGSEMHRVKVGSAPVSVAVNSASGRVYVANAGDGTVSVLDGKSDAVVATIPIGSHPYSIAADSATGKVYITHTFGDQLTILDGATNTAVDLKTGSSDLIAIDSRTATIYLLGYGGAVTALDGTSHKMTSMPVGRHAWALTLNDATGAVYVTRIEDADLAAVNDQSSEASILPAGAIPCAIAVNSKANTLYVANYGDSTVTVINSTTGRATNTIPVGEHPKAIAFDPSRNLVYVANTSSGTVTVIDAENKAVVATLPAGKNPYALAVVPGSNSLYVANEADGNSSRVVDLSLIRKASLAPLSR